MQPRSGRSPTGGGTVSALILAFDTSTDVCTVALLRADAIGEGPAAGGPDPAVLACRSVEAGRGHTRLLLGMCDEVLGQVGVAPADLRAIAVGTGPGTFTGVRIGVATARAMALSLDIPVWGVPSLDALAAAAAEAAEAAPGDHPDGLGNVCTLIPVVDARRGQFFAARYERTQRRPGDVADVWVRAGAFFAADPADLVARIVGGGTGGPAVGEGSTMAVGDARLLALLEMPGLSMTVEAAFLVRGRSRLSLPPFCWERGDPEAVCPVYVRRPDADLHITRMKDPWAS